MSTLETVRTELVRLYDALEFLPDKALVCELGELAVGVFPRGTQGTKQVVSVVLNMGLITPPDLQFLPWGVVTLDGEIVATGRTDRYGAFVVDLLPGKYHVKYVTDVSNQLDRSILNRIDDLESQIMLEASFDDLKVPIPSFLSVSWSREYSGLPAMSFSSEDDSSHELPEGQHAGVSRDGKWYRIKMPVATAHGHGYHFEFAAARITAVGAGEKSYSRMIPVVVDPQSNCYFGELELSQLLPEGTVVHGINCIELHLEDDALVPTITLEQFEDLLDEPLVKFDKVALAKVQRIHKLI